MLSHTTGCEAILSIVRIDTGAIDINLGLLRGVNKLAMTMLAMKRLPG